MKQMEITFKSGAQIVVDATELSTEAGVLQGDLRGMKWTTPDDAKRKLFRISLDNIDAIVEIR